MRELYIGDDIIYRAGVKELRLADIKISLELNKSGSLEFVMPPSHPYYDKMNKLKTYIDLYDNSEFIWRFRVMNTEDEF